MNVREIFKAVLNGKGYSKESLSASDLFLFRTIIERHYRKILLELGGVKDEYILSVPMHHYHEISNKVDHAALWGKKNRILSHEDYKRFLESDLFTALKNELGELRITDEEKSGYGEIYWRLVRPPTHSSGDVGPLHADAWFWELGHGEMPEGYSRVKFWVVIHCEEGKNGLNYVEGSHRHIYTYDSQQKAGISKPVFDPADHDLNVELFATKPGNFIVFNDRLLHGGQTGGEATRVSFEFTLLLSNEYIAGLAKDA